MKTIIFYVRNTSHLKNYVDPYVKHFNDMGYKLHILHNNKMTPEISTDSAPEFTYEMTDIFEMPVSKLVKKIKSLNPAGIISINFLSVMDLFVNRLGYQLNIPTLFMEHGLIFQSHVGKYIKSKNKLRSYFRLAKYIQKYLSLSIKSRHFFFEMRILLGSMIKKKYAKSPYSAFLFYAKNGYHALEKTYDLNRANVNYSGYPMSSSNIETFKGRVLKQVLYIHQPFVFHGTSKISYQQEFDYIKDLYSICKQNGYQLEVKLHPAETQERYVKGINNNEIIIEKDTDLVERMSQCSIVFGHYSTALFMAIVLKKPLVILKFPGIEEHFSDVYSSFTIKANDIQHLALLFKDHNLLEINSKGYDDFIETYVGKDNSYQARTKAIVSVFENIQSS